MFEWDEAKAASNHTKHGVSFDEAASAFDDPFGLDVPICDIPRVRPADYGLHAPGPAASS